MTLKTNDEIFAEVFGAAMDSQVHVRFSTKSDENKITQIIKKTGSRVTDLTDKGALIDAGSNFRREMQAAGLGWLIDD
jgi:hypothetical protein